VTPSVAPSVQLRVDDLTALPLTMFALVDRPRPFDARADEKKAGRSPLSLNRSALRRAD